jgi:predicted acylesterase/phospholipase RssA
VRSRAALRADSIARQLLEETQLRAADIVIRPDAPVRHVADFENPDSVIAAGELAAERVLADIRGVLERHRSLFVRRRPRGAPCAYCGAPSWGADGVGAGVETKGVDHARTNG